MACLPHFFAVLLFSGPTDERALLLVSRALHSIVRFFLTQATGLGWQIIAHCLSVDAIRYLSPDSIVSLVARSARIYLMGATCFLAPSSLLINAFRPIFEFFLSFLKQDDCGEWVTALCPYGEDGCPDNEGDYDVLMPEPFENTSGSGYKIRVQDVSDESDYDCSDEFYLLASEDTSTMGEEDGPTLEVTAPDAGDVAMAGDEYTVEWDYDDGFGSQVGRFAIDLYTTGGSGDCGTFYATICDKPTIGCKDSSECGVCS